MDYPVIVTLSHNGFALTESVAVTVVSRSHGSDAHEQSLKQELFEHASSNQIVTVLDSVLKRSLRYLIDDSAYDTHYWFQRG